MSKEERLAKKLAKKEAKELKSKSKQGVVETPVVEPKQTKTNKDINTTLSSF